jgi:hypothetical protein
MIMNHEPTDQQHNLAQHAYRRCLSFFIDSFINIWSLALGMSWTDSKYPLFNQRPFLPKKMMIVYRINMITYHKM